MSSSVPLKMATGTLLIGSTSALTRKAGKSQSSDLCDRDRLPTRVVGNGHVDAGRRVLLSEDQGLTQSARSTRSGRLTYRPPQQNPTTPTCLLRYIQPWGVHPYSRRGVLLDRLDKGLDLGLLDCIARKLASPSMRYPRTYRPLGW